MVFSSYYENLCLDYLPSFVYVYRGIYFPIKNNISLSFLFPMNWLLVGCVGLILDIVKAPGYLLGTIFSPFLKTSRRPSARI